MRAVTIALLFLSACGDDGGGGDPRQIDAAPIDVAPTIDARGQDVCPTCPAGQICIAVYDGTCNGGPRCVDETVTGCETEATCSQACQDAYCNPNGGNIYTCMNENDCPSGNQRPPGVLACYGI